jgi:hypothetical protein
VVGAYYESLIDDGSPEAQSLGLYYLNDAGNVPREGCPMNLKTIAGLATVLLLSADANAQHLWWDLEGQKDATCLYGQITVLATNPGIYYCGANWHPGEPAGGYCGIQHNGEHERRTIFSIWDTSPSLHPRVTESHPKTIFNRFGGEGEGSHTHMLWDWKLGETFHFFVRKEPGEGDTTDVRYYVFDRAQRKWLHSATITSPNGGKRSVATIGGSLNSFLENFTGQDRAVPKLALYRLWLGTDIDKMKFLMRAGGDGIWGQLHNAYFLAEGEKTALDSVFAKMEAEYGKPVFGGKEKPLAPLADQPLPTNAAKILKSLPRAGKVKEK